MPRQICLSPLSIAHTQAPQELYPIGCFLIGRILHTKRHMPSRYVIRRRLTVPRLVVKEDVGAEGLEEFPFVSATEEQRLVDADAPTAQRADHALVGGGAAGGH